MKMGEDSIASKSKYPDHSKANAMKKFHFGHKIAVVYTLFAIGMTAMLIMSMQFDHELVTENYYENELSFQGRKDAFDNMATATFKVNVALEQGAVSVKFEGLPANEQPEGTLSLYKPDKAAFDEQHELVLDADRRMRIEPKGKQGRYKLELRFEIDGTDYYVHKDILL